MDVLTPITYLVADRIKAAREARGWTRAYLADTAGVSKSYVSRLEAGAYPRPSLDRISRIARALGMRVTDLTDAGPPGGQAALRLALVAQLGIEDGPAVAALLAAWPALALAERAAIIRVIRALIPPHPVSST